MGWCGRLRARLFATRPADVQRIVDALETAGCQPCLAGGWGIDALLGRITRRHDDIDVIIDQGTDTAAQRALAELGYCEVRTGVAAGPYMPVRTVVRDPPGRTVDLLPMSLSALGELPAAGSGDASHEVVVVGTIRGASFRCLSASVQLMFHEGYEHGPEERQDVALLREYLGLDGVADGDRRHLSGGASA